MDFWTIGGVVTSIGVVVFLIIHEAEGVGVGIFINMPAFILCVIGPFICLAISNSWKDFRSLIGIMKTAFFVTPPDAKPVIEQLVRYAEIARRDGILALEGVVDEIKDPFLVKGVQLAVDGTDPELIEQIMSTELEYLEERHKVGRKMMDVLSLLSPSLGLVGCVMGLILMLVALAKSGGDPSVVAAKMATAMVATFYGVALANMVYIPLANKLNRKHLEEKLLRQIVMRGVMSIQSGDNPRIVEQKLKIFLPPKER
ncbi:MAG: MotA/TolQ/ExbB proton channel family protein [Planctomycetota bacterium]